MLQDNNVHSYIVEASLPQIWFGKM